VAKATVEKYMVRSRKPPSPTWIAVGTAVRPKNIEAVRITEVPSEWARRQERPVVAAKKVAEARGLYRHYERRAAWIDESRLRGIRAGQYRAVALLQSSQGG